MWSAFSRIGTKTVLQTAPEVRASLNALHACTCIASVQPSGIIGRPTTGTRGLCKRNKI